MKYILKIIINYFFKIFQNTIFKKWGKNPYLNDYILSTVFSILQLCLTIVKISKLPIQGFNNNFFKNLE